MQIRITATPPGEAPEHIREAWVGLVLPVPSKFSNRRRALGFGVLSGPKSRIGLLIAMLFGRLQRFSGYIVDANVAIDLLQAHSPRVAEWWRQNVPHFIEPGRFFLFATECCEVVHEELAGGSN